MNGFAYLDKYGILHTTTRKEQAEKYAVKLPIIPTDIASGDGFIDENGMNVYIEITDKGTEFWHGNSRNKEEQLTEAEFSSKYPKTYQLYKQLR